MSQIDPEIPENPQTAPPGDQTGLTRAQLHQSLSWLFGIMALVELGIIIKLLMETGR